MSPEPRPRLHFVPSTGWINDPHGVTFRDGRYHLFFQHVPDSVVWRQDCSWGHATSTDLLHWEQQPVALRPGDGDDGCWSGCVVVDDDGAPQLLYTSVHSDDLDHGVVRVAHPEDGGWSSWRKGEVLVSPARAGTAVFRDPAVFRDGDDWVMLVGRGGEDRTAGAEAFVSRDLITWEHRGLVATRTADAEGVWTGDAWECPQLLRLPQGVDVLVVSVWSAQETRYVAATSGSYADDRFREGTWQQLTFGPGHYAASGFTDRDGRSCLVFWIRGVARPGAWSGCISLPYVVGRGQRPDPARAPPVGGVRPPGRWWGLGRGRPDRPRRRVDDVRPGMPASGGW